MSDNLVSDEAGVSKTGFLSAMARLPGAVALITTGRGNDRFGLTASAICSLSADPPSIIVCVNKTAAAHDEILRNGYFAVNLLTSNQGDLATLFTQKGVDRFASHAWSIMVTGAPVLKPAHLTFDCTLDRAIDGFSHSILIGLVAGLFDPFREEEEALVWHRRRYRACAEI